MEYMSLSQVLRITTSSQYGQQSMSLKLKRQRKREKFIVVYGTWVKLPS
jgi:hypothetical protein